MKMETQKTEERWENPIQAFFNRTLQLIARTSPGATTWRVRLHRWRGVRIGKNVWIGYDTIIETAYPRFVEIRDNAVIGMRNTIIAHFLDSTGVIIEENVFLGPGVIVLPGVVIGKGAVVMAGSVVTASVPPMTMVQGNPAKIIAKIGMPLNDDQVTMREFLKTVKPIRKN